MNNTKTFLAVLLAGAIGATPVLAASEACVQQNRIFSTKIVDASTVLITDMEKKQYTVHMRGTCVGFDKNAENLSFRTKTQLGCIGSGDSISYNLPGERVSIKTRGSLQTPCFIDNVTAGAPG